MAITVRFDDIGLRRSLQSNKKSQVPFATRLTLNALARNAKKDVDQHVSRILHNPKAYTKRMMVTENAKGKVNPFSRLKAKDRLGKNSPNKVLEHLFEGGGRRGKGMEGKLLSLGLLPRGQYAVPGKAAAIDANGNIRRSFLNKMLSFLSSAKLTPGESTLPPGLWVRRFDRKQKKKRKAQGKSGNLEYFVVGKQIKAQSRSRRGDSDRRPQAILLFVKKAKYKEYIDLGKIARKVIVRDLEFEFNKAYDLAERTAR